MLRVLIVSVAGFSAVAFASENVSKVNGSIRIDADSAVGNLSTVNGSIEIGAGARAEEVETVNGSIRLEPKVIAESVETVNGSVRVGTEVQVLESAETVNGRISLDKQSQVGGSLETVNGDLVLDEARVSGALRTVNGDITVGADSRVGGGIHVEKNQGWGLGSKRNVPTVVIGPRAVVDGTLKFDREVKLYVSRSATIGPVVGATPEIFDGDAP